MQSRYYNPEIGRFINADDIDYLGADGSLTSYNLYVYCLNNPVQHSDAAGKFVITAMVGAIIGGAVAGALISSASYLINSGLNNTEVTAGGLLCAAGIGAVVGGIGGAAGVTTAAIAKVALSAAAGIISGISAGCSFDGRTDQKILAGFCAGILGFGSTYLGTMIDTSKLSAGATAFATYASTLFTGVPAELISTSIQQGINNIPATNKTSPTNESEFFNRYASPWSVY